MKKIVLLAFYLTMRINLVYSIENSFIHEIGRININQTYQLSTSGCSVHILGSVDSQDAFPYINMQSFQGTITFSGGPDCPSGTLVVGYAIPDGSGGWTPPLSASIGIYLVGTEDPCQAETIRFVGLPTANTDLLNIFGEIFAKDFKKTIGCE